MQNQVQPEIILVAGATGYLGSEICSQLIKKNVKVRGLVRSTSDPVKVGRLKELGVDVVEGDLKNKDSLINVVKGVSVIISTVSSSLSRQEGDSIQSVDDDGQINLIDAASSAGTTQFVYISFCPMPFTFPLQSAKREVEKKLLESGMNYCILQPTYFMEVWLSPALNFDYLNSKATVYGDGTSRVSWISIKDVASFAVMSINNPFTRNKTIKLGGPGALSLPEVINLFEGNSEKKFDVQYFAEELIRKQQAEAPDPLSESFAALMLGVARGSVIDMTKTFADFPGLTPVSVNDYVNLVSQSNNP